MIYVIKRDGEKVPFDSTRIYNAVSSAEVPLDGLRPQMITEQVVGDICDYLRGEDSINVETIQDFVVERLMASPWHATAKSYIGYRRERDIAREEKAEFTEKLFNFIGDKDDSVSKDNANKDARNVSTARDLLAGIVSKHYYVKHIAPRSVALAHELGFIYAHDSDYALTPLSNCSLIDYPDMLKRGFKIGDASITTPNSIGVATTVATQIVQGVASAQYGGSTLCEIDRYLAPYVKASRDKLLKEKEAYQLPDSWVDWRLEKEVHDAMQTLLYQVNTLHTVNGQSPFITISLGHDTTEFGRMITREYLKVHMNGLGEDHTTPVFPKVIFLLEEGFNMNPGDPNYDLKQLAMECSAKRIYPDFISAPLNRMVTGAKKEIVTSMGKL